MFPSPAFTFVLTFMWNLLSLMMDVSEIPGVREQRAGVALYRAAASGQGSHCGIGLLANPIPGAATTLSAIASNIILTTFMVFNPLFLLSAGRRRRHLAFGRTSRERLLTREPRYPTPRCRTSRSFWSSSLSLLCWPRAAYGIL